MDVLHRIKKVLSLEVLIGIFNLGRYLKKKCFNFHHSEATEIESSSQYHLLFSIIKHAGFQKLQKED